MANYLSQIKDINDMMQYPEERKNRRFALATEGLAKAKSDSKYWGSWKGTVAMLPSAIKDTMKKVLKRKSTK